MIRHIILWKLRDELTAQEKQSAAEAAKKELESLAGKIDGLLKINVHINGLESSNADMMLESELADEAALQAYQVHPAHVHAADTYVRPYTQVRMCMDFKAE